MSGRVLLFVIMYTLAACNPRPPSTSTTFRLTAQRNDTGTWTAKFGDYQMIIEHRHYNKNPIQEDQDGTWTLKVKHTLTTKYDETKEDVDKQIDVDTQHNFNNASTTANAVNQFPSNNDNVQVDQISRNDQDEQLLSNSEDEQVQVSNNDDEQIVQFPTNNEDEQDSLSNNTEQVSQISGNNEGGQVDQQFSNNEDGQVDLIPSDVEDTVDQLSNRDSFGHIGQVVSSYDYGEMENETKVEQMTSEEREHYIAEQERKLIMDRYPRSRSLKYDAKEIDLVSKGYRFYPEVGWLRLNTAHWQWDQARKSCEFDGGHLAIPDTLLKIKNFKRVLKDNVDIIERAVLKNQVFVGVYVSDNSRRFITVKGEPFVPESVSIWFPNEPNDADPGEDCVTMHLEGKLRDVPCFYNLPFLCHIH